jgi:hypothetical protein
MFKPLMLRFRGTTGELIPINATGGNFVFEESVGDEIYKIHVFRDPGNSRLTVENISNKFNELEVLLVAGGGAGGAADNEVEGGGGGGAGGMRNFSHTIAGPGNYSLVVGHRGTGSGGNGRCNPGNPGGNSSFLSFSASGGGGGGTGQGTPGRNGGSGGGSNRRTSTIGFGNVPATTPVQGHNGVRLGGNTGGGGGGAGSAATDFPGGAPRATTILSSANASASSVGVVSGSSVLFARGGQGGISTSGSGYASGPDGSGNGGAGGYAAGERAGDPRQYMRPGANGGSGVVIIKYRIQ